jgi:hypothetical protein
MSERRQFMLRRAIDKAQRPICFDFWPTLRQGVIEIVGLIRQDTQRDYRMGLRPTRTTSWLVPEAASEKLRLRSCGR